MTKFILDSADLEEYHEAKKLLANKNLELWGATTNPTLIAGSLAKNKLSRKQAQNLQKKLVLEILKIVPGAVSCEVYADFTTTAQEMAEEGREIAALDPRIAVKLPTTKNGMKARTLLRKENITVNNTLVFSLEQIFAICLHEKLIRDTYRLPQKPWPDFISPFVGRLDDTGINGMDLIEQGMELKKTFYNKYPDLIWLLEASIRNVSHLQKGIELGVELATAPLKAYREYVASKDINAEDEFSQKLTKLPIWHAPSLSIKTLEDFDEAVSKNQLNINHPLTDKGLKRFAEDWNKILL